MYTKKCVILMNLIWTLHYFSFIFILSSFFFSFLFSFLRILTLLFLLKSIVKKEILNKIVSCCDRLDLCFRIETINKIEKKIEKLKKLLRTFLFLPKNFHSVIIMIEVSSILSRSNLISRSSSSSL